MQSDISQRELDQVVSGQFERTFRLERAADSKESSDDDRTIDMVFSSEEPYERWWGVEILDHGASSVRLGRLNGNGHPLLVNHDPNRQAGVIQKAWIGEDRKGRSVARFGKGAFASEIYGDVKDGIRELVSVGYMIHKVIEQSTSKSGESAETREMDGDQFRALVQSDDFKRSIQAKRAAGGELPVYRVVDWEPYENSLVAIPADATVGVGRSAQSKTEPEPPIQEIKTMTTEVKEPTIDLSAVHEGARVAEQARIREIHAMGDHYKMAEQAQKAIAEGATADSFRKLVLDKLQAEAPKVATERNLGLSEKEVRGYSLSRAVIAQAEGKLEKAGFEYECHRAAEQKFGSGKRGGVLVPHDILSRQLHAVQAQRGDQLSLARMQHEIQMRDLTVGTASAGGYLVATQNLAGSFIEMLRARSKVIQLGAQTLPGLRDNITIPKQTAASTFYWLATEATAITESQPTFGQLALTPKNGGSYVEFSKQLMKQSNPAVDMLVMNDISRVAALAVDSATLQGTGASGQPTGVINTAGIGGVTGTTLNFAGIVEFETDVAAANADVANMSYLTTPTVRGLLKGRERTGSTIGNYVWGGTNGEKTLNGYNADVTTQMPAASMLFGDWSQIIIAEWGTLELEVNPYANFAAGIVGIRSWVTVDIGVRQAAAFSLASTIT